MILIPLVLAIWSYTVYKYFFWSNDEALPVAEAPAAIAPDKAQVQEDPDFALLGDYRDPFLGKMNIRRESSPSVDRESTQPQPVKTIPAPVTIPLIDWSIIRYNGTVRRSGNGEEMDGLLSIQGKLHHVTPGVKVKGIEIISMDADSIRLRFLDETKTVAKR